MALRRLTKSLCFLSNSSKYINNCAKINSGLLINCSNQKLIVKGYNTSNNDNPNEIVGLEEIPKTKKKKVFIPRITLLSESDEISIITLEEAHKIAKRRDLHLVKIVDFDTKTKRPVYKLMTMKEFIKAESKMKAEAKEAKEKMIKEEKSIALTSKISIHDLDTKIKSIQKMLRKKHGIRVLITVDENLEKVESIRTYIIEKCSDIAKVLNKSESKTTFKIILRPILENLGEENPKSEEEEDLERYIKELSEGKIE